MRIKNFVDANGVKVNSESYLSDNSRFFRRFVWVDTVTGLKDKKLEYIRLPTLVEFHLKTKPDSEGKIFIPVMDITYTERAVSDVSATDSSEISQPLVLLVNAVLL